MKTILQILATKHNLPIAKIEEAVLHQFKHVSNVMKEGKFKSIRLPYLGKFHVNPGRLKYLNNEGSDNRK